LMKLSTYISDLLYRYECVIIPNFGGFVTNAKPARISTSSTIFYPPNKSLTFNNHLKNNDGLLANYIAKVDQVPFKSAMNFIQFEVEQWIEELQNTDLILDKIGKLSLKNKHIIFEPQNEINYLTESYGLNAFTSPEIKRKVYIKQVEKLEKKIPVLVTEKTKETPNYLKYAAMIAIGLLVAGFGGNKLYKNYKNKQMVIAAQKQQKEIENNIQEATFIVSDPLPSIILNATITSKPFHVIAGAFRFPENAKRKVRQLKKIGFNARILGVNQWGLTQVSFDSYNTNREARKDLHIIRETIDQDAWLLVQDL